MKVKPAVLGLASYVPGIYRLFSKTGGTNSAKYCYAIWLRHLVKAYQHGLLTSVPCVVAELGPGDSLGIGLAALLSGSEHYYALDLVPYATTQRNLAIFDQLVELFRRRSPIPGDDDLPLHNLRLESYDFPSDLLPDAQLGQALAPKRLDAIRNDLMYLGNREAQTEYVEYVAPWNDPQVVTASSVDMIFSQAVLEHVDNLDQTYHALYQWLKPTGFMSHAIDYDSHHTSAAWNGHWSYSGNVWKVIRGRRAYLINREPHSMHIDLLHRHGFTIVSATTRTDTSGITRKDVSSQFARLSDQDLVTRSALIQAKKSDN